MTTLQAQPTVDAAIEVGAALTLPPSSRLCPLPSFALESGDVLHGAHLAYELTGPVDGPLVVALGGITADRHVGGWWARQVGPGRALDTAVFRVLSFDFLGGAGASTRSWRARGACRVTPRDQARGLAALLDHLGIAQADAVVGASYGGMVGLALAAQLPNRARHLIAISAADRPHPLATAWRSIQRRILADARARGDAAQGVALARALAITCYRTPEEFAARFDQPPAFDPGGAAAPRFAVEDYLDARGEALAASFDAEAYARLSESLDLHRVDPAAITAPTTLVGVTSDRLVPIEQIRALSARCAGPTRRVEIDSHAGHDAFLVEHEQIAAILRGALREVRP